MGTSFKSKDFLLSDACIASVKIDAHIHLYHEFLYFKSGDASYVEGTGTFRLSPGDVIVTKPHVMHAISFSGETVYSRTFIQMSPHMLSTIPHNLTRFITGRHSANSFIIPAETAEKYGLYRYFKSGAELLADRSEKNIYLAELLFREFALYANEAIEDEQKNASAPENPLITSIKEYLDSNYANALNLDEIGKRFFMSKYSICHLFKAETGITVSDYVSLKRIAAVKHAADESSSLNEIYRLCGFKDYSTFYRTVKKYTGLKPSEFYKLSPKNN